MPVRLKNRPSRCAQSIRRPLVLAGARRVDLDDVLHRFDDLRPARRIVGEKGIASLENMGALRALETFPPTQMEMPSLSASAIAWPQTV
jgi:hypothetical protein